MSYLSSARPGAHPVTGRRLPAALFNGRSERAAGKVKRLRRDSRVLLAPCTVRGRPLGAPFEGHARVLAPEEETRGERALAQRYGLGRELFERSVDIMRIDMCYLKIMPGAWG